MKLKDIEVGKDYAIGAPNATYEEWHRARGRIVKVGVHGVAGGYTYSHMSDHPTYVEFEPVDCAATKYRHKLIKDPTQTPHGERVSRWAGDDKLERVVVYRCSATNVLRPWDEYLEAKAERDVEATEARERRIVEENHHASVKERFKALGFTVSGYKTYEITLSTKDAEKILERLEKV